MNKIIYEKISEVNDEYNLFHPGGDVLVGVSGGADSVCLLLALKEFYPALGIRVIHVNHMLRGKESDRDEEFVRDLCKRLKVTLDVYKVDVNEYAEREKVSIELAARNLRYECFRNCAKKHGLFTVATAHTLNDNVETFLFNLARGTSLEGLKGIPPERKEFNSMVTYIRPIIRVSRNEVEEYLKERGEKYVTDSTNLSDDYTRNFIRHNVVPLFEKINPSFVDTIKRTVTDIAEVNYFLDYSAYEFPQYETVFLAKQPYCVLKRKIYTLYKEYTCQSLIESVHIKKIIDHIRKSPRERRGKIYEVCIPGGVSCIITHDKTFFQKTERKKKEKAVPFETELSFAHEAYTPDGNFIVALMYEFVKWQPPKDYILYSSTPADSDIVNKKLTIKNRRGGEVIRSKHRTKKVKELYNHAALPQQIRDTLPLICMDDKVVLIPDIAIADSIFAANRMVDVNVYVKKSFIESVIDPKNNSIEQEHINEKK